MTYQAIEPFQTGHIPVGGGHKVWFGLSGRPDGRPALIIHGGPGSGSSSSAGRLFDPEHYLIVQIDQRGCGRSMPHAGDTMDALKANDTDLLIADIEAVRGHVGIQRWLVMGGSWGSTLALAYAQAHPQRIEAIILHSIALTRPSDIGWISWGLRRFFPREHEAFRAAVGGAKAVDIVPAYARLLRDPDPAVHHAAARAWCAWEQAIVDLGGQGPADARWQNERFALGFARLVTHYWANAAWRGEHSLIDGAKGLADIPATLLHGRLDFSSPLEGPWLLHNAWPGSRLQVVDGAGHGGSDSAMAQAILAATEAHKRR